MLHEERKRKKDMSEMKEFEMIALALLNLKHQPASFDFLQIWQKRNVVSVEPVNNMIQHANTL